MTCVSFSTLALAGAASLAMAGAAAAQPMGGDDHSDWGGIYAGVNGGWNGWSSKTDASHVTVNQLTGVNNGSGVVVVAPTTFLAPPFQNDTSRATWGGQVGINLQRQRLVFGVEGDINALYGKRAVTGVFTLPATALTTGSTVTVTRDTDPRWMATLRGRVGWDFDRVLLYATGGVAWTHLREGGSYTYAPTVTSAVAAANPGTTFGPFNSLTTVGHTRTGWVVGGGAEWKVWRNLTVAAEYKHADFGKKTFFFGSTLADGVFETPSNGLTDDMVTAKVNYRFWGPVF
jgi:outer membrane immunogenic protein